MSVAYIIGDTLYKTHVTFFIGGTPEQVVEQIVDMSIKTGQFDGWVFHDFEEANEVTDWEDNDQYRSFLIKILTKDITCLNSDMTKPQEIYFYISVQSETEWYRHFDYIISGERGGININYQIIDSVAC